MGPPSENMTHPVLARSQIFQKAKGTRTGISFAICPGSYPEQDFRYNALTEEIVDQTKKDGKGCGGTWPTTFS